MKQIDFRGKVYPCRMTMGALRRFKIETGIDVSRIGNDIALFGTLLWCCVRSACNADGVQFDYDLETFADSCDLSVITDFARSMSEQDDGEVPKKKTRRPTSTNS